MAILTSTELAELRRHVAEQMSTIGYEKLQINLALQAIEDWFETNRPALATAINVATAPFVFTNPQKALLVRFWLRQKFARGG